MKSLSSRRPADYVSPELTPARVERMWSAIESPRRRTVVPRLAGALAMLAVVAGGVWLARGHAPVAAPVALAARGDVIVTQGGSSLTLPDGSSLVLGAATKLSVADASGQRLRLELKAGAVTCDVVHVEGRVFEVAAADKLVRVRGTRFTVSMPPAGAATASSPVAVHVERGHVEVLQAGGPEPTLIASLGPGQSWSQEAIAPAPPEPPVEARRVPPVLAPPPETAAMLLKHANAARVSARPEDAARDYDRLRRRFPDDPRAGLASFELARIRLDTLRDPRGALEALRFAVTHGHGAFVPEDAEALEIDALGRLGERDACARARTRFVAAHPQSPHAARVARACGE